MADDKEKRDARDRATVSGSETYEVDYFANNHGITRKQAQALIDRVGNNRAALEAAIADTATTAASATPRRTGATAAPKRRSATKKTPQAARRSPSSTTSVVEKTIGSPAASTAVARGTKKLVDPAARAVAPATRRVASARRTVTTAARRGTKSLRATIASAPKATRKGADAAIDGAKSAVTSRTASLVGAAAAGLVTGLAVNLGRKLVVQAPSALAGDWLEALKVEHTLALALFDQLQATESNESGQRSVLLTQLKHALGKHAFTEENVIYPALRDSGDKADADKLNHEHGYVKQYLYDLENMDSGAPAFLEKIAAFRAELEAHIREEEDVIFPPLHAALGEAGNAKVTAQANKEGFKLA